VIGHSAGRIARIGLALCVLRVAAAQTAPQDFLYKHLQSFEAEAKSRPPTRKERLHAYLIGMAGPVILLREAGAAGLSQALDSPPEWGQGAAGFGKRFANDMAYNGVRCSLTYAGSLLLKEDDRYFASEQKGVWPRVRHAVTSVFTAQKDDGRMVFSTSSVAGFVGAGLISRAWSPPSWRTPDATARSIGIDIASAAGFNLVREFLSDIVPRRK
jgi:hypothetical protein